MRSTPRRFDKQRFEGGLAIVSVGSEIGERGAPSFRRTGWPVKVWINAAVQRCYTLRAETMAERE
jgi:hypothetical protein